MKFLLDENIGKKVVKYLMNSGHFPLRIRELQPGMEDFDVLELAYSNKAILITSDKDFGELIFKENQNHCGVILLRLMDETSKNKIKAINYTLLKHKQIENNFIVIVETKNGFKSRIRGRHPR